MRPSAFLIFIALSGLPTTELVAAPHQPHAHGKAELEVTIQDGQVRGVFRTPMDNLLGFEHLPKTDAQKKSLERLRQRLEDTSVLFRPNGEAQCTARSPEAKSSMFAGRVNAGHSDLEYRFGFDCEKPELLKQIEARLLTDYPRLHEIRSQLVTPTTQRGVSLKRNNRLLTIQ
ncbi:MAG: hypothetical protein RJA58_1049 [Pseudomonadota bacterium]|jgi:hypothetical protein